MGEMLSSDVGDGRGNRNKRKKEPVTGISYRDCPYCRCAWISISLRSWCSSPSFSIWDLKRTFRATMKWLSLSRARYTFPNFPLPRGRPISKSSIVRRRLIGEKEKSLRFGGGWRVGETSCSPSSFTLPSLGPFPFSRALSGCLVNNCQSHEATFTRGACSSSLGPTPLPFSDTKQRRSHGWDAGHRLTCYSY